MRMSLFKTVVGFTLLSGMTLNAAERPNLLFVYTDDQRYDAFSTVQKEQGDKGRFPWFKTPHLDRLAAEGVRFRNAFVVNSLCSPSRAVNLSGRYNHLNGIASNFRDFPVDNVTHASLLRAAGYTTAYIGKWHMGNQKARPNFDYAASYIGHSHYFDSTFVVQGKPVETKGWIDDVATDYAIDFMEKQKGAKKPWMMVLGFKTPHGPFDPPKRAQDRFKGAEAKVVPNCTVPPPYDARVQEKVARLKLGETMPTNLNYLRCVSAMDECLGRLMAALDENNLRENTVVIYTSDNGFYQGEHGLGDKRSAYEESLRVPFVVRYPALGKAAQGRVCDQMVLNLDLVRSMLDFAGVEAPQEIQGRSWKPLLTKEVADWRSSWFYEYFAEAQRGSRVPDIKAVRTDTAKLITYTDHAEWTELFDLAADPYEINNLYNDSAHAGLRTEMERELARLSSETGYVVPAYTDRPFWWNLPGGANWVPDKTPRLLLGFEEGSPRDVSGNKNMGRLKGVEVVKGRNGKKAFQFDGKSYIDVPKSESIDPSMKALTIEVVAKIDKQSGVLVAHGGASLGYCMAVKDGHALFSVVTGKQPVTIKTKKPQSGWIQLKGILTTGQQVELFVNGRRVGIKKTSGLINKNPNNSVQIGADTGSPVMKQDVGGFSGLIESVRIYSGEKR
ncbi:MAG: sulfatase-like hydrolase/transferase [Kiritimatiellales bacterium]|nr:sulfatase-like hydrolase/transferase [Kiritimatiellales bacterium]